jgi:hypothetical protein
LPLAEAIVYAMSGIIAATANGSAHVGEKVKGGMNSAQRNSAVAVLRLCAHSTRLTDCRSVGGALIPIKVANGELTHRRPARVDLLPQPSAAPGNDPVAPVLGEDIGAPVAVEIPEQQLIDPISLGVEVAPLGLARRGVVPGRAVLRSSLPGRFPSIAAPAFMSQAFSLIERTYMGGIRG